MPLAQVWIDATRRNLLGTFTELRNTLGANYTAGDGALTLSRTTSNITPGTILSIGLNIFYVWAVNGAIVTVDGGQNGSTDINLIAGALVRVNPKFTDFDIWQELANDLGSLSGEGLTGYQSSDLTYNPVYTGYDLGATAAANLLDIYEVKYVTPGPEKDMPRLPRSAWRLTRNANVTDISSGMSLQILRPSPQNVAGYLVRVVWKSNLVMPATTATDLSTTGLQASAYDLPPIGTAINLMSGREVPRNFIQDQGDTRRATEVPPGAIMQSTNGLKQRRQSRISIEKARLATMYAITAD
jgi:hypothetical protein